METENPSMELQKKVSDLIDIYNQGPLFFVKKAYESGLYSLGILNDLLLLSCLYIKNMFYLSYDTNLNNILPTNMCFDLFQQSTCNTKINKLLNMKSYKNYINKIPMELRPRQKGGQRGGSNSCKNVNTSIICDDGRPTINEYNPSKPNVYLDLFHNEIQTNTKHEGEESKFVLFYLEFNQYTLFQLHQILNIYLHQICIHIYPGCDMCLLP